MFVIEGTYFSHFVYYVNSAQIARPGEVLSSPKNLPLRFGLHHP